MLLSLRVDEVITWNYGVIFLPIWVWNAIALVGTVVGVAYFIKKKSLRSVLDMASLLTYTGPPQTHTHTHAHTYTYTHTHTLAHTGKMIPASITL